jgi:SAM-dependent methyltransferase
MDIRIKKLLTISHKGEIARLLISRLFPIKIKYYKDVKQFFHSKYGLEVGGPSGDFKPHGCIPIYNIVNKLDGCNFSRSTIWEGAISNEKYFYYKDRDGRQFISEATTLNFCSDNFYDFVCSSNCLEHVANPLKAIGEWIRVTKVNGVICLIVPMKEYCFDHKRPVTKFLHLQDDYLKNVDENDLTHLTEILKLHDFKMDPQSGDIRRFKERSIKNILNRAMHHHVFDMNLLELILNFFKLKILLKHSNKNGHLIIGQKIH